MEGVDEGEPRGVGGSLRGDSLAASGSGLVRFLVGSRLEEKRMYLIRLASVAEDGLVIGW